MELDYIFKPDDLNELLAKYGEANGSALPFPHFVIDDFLPEHVLDKVSNFPGRTI